MLPSFLPSLKGSTLSSPHSAGAAAEAFDLVGLLKVAKYSSHHAIAGDILFVAVAQSWPPKHQRADASPVHLHAFDPVRRHGALDQRMLAQDAEPLRRLLGEQGLL